MNEHRGLKRWELIYYLRVFDVRTGKLLGHVVDITVEGIKLIHSEAIQPDRDYAIAMEFPAAGGERARQVFDARSCWSDPDVNTDFRVTGFQLLDPSEDAVLLIHDIIEELHFAGPPEPSENIYALSYSGEEPQGARRL